MTDTDAPAAPRPPIALRTVVFDTDDPRGLAEFYLAVLGGEFLDIEDDWIKIAVDSGTRLGFQLDPEHQPPTWPNNGVPQQVHLDLTVEDLATAGAYVESLGAEPIAGPDDDPSFTVFADPSGHLFCLCV